MKQDSYCFLLHFSPKIGQFWNQLYQDKFFEVFSKKQFISSVDVFIEKINSQQKNVFLSFQEPNNFFIKLKENINNITLIDYKHELFLLEDIFNIHKDFQSIVYFDSLFPLWDTKITSNIFSNHTSYRADYSYGENLPPGISPSIFSRTLIDIFKIENKKVFSEQKFLMPLSNYIEKNINDFHVEIHYEEPDLRVLRLDFSSKNLRSLIKIEQILKKLSKNKSPYQQLNALLKASPEILYRAPTYLEIELIQDCEYKCIFCPRQYLDLKTQVMSETVFTQVKKYLKSGLRDTSICLGGLGEPLQHQEISEIIKDFLDQESLHFLIIETNGYYLEKVFSIIKHKNFKKTQWIININGLKNYGFIHGVDSSYREKVKDNLKVFTENLKTHNSNYLEQVHLQMLKINENEKEVDSVDKLAQDLGVNFLLQKYNSYIALMPERRVSDMTPLERFPCWHLRRDLLIRANGDVSFCKQDIQNNHTLGNLNEKSIQSIWNQRREHWINHFQGNYSTVPDCQACDEYFTFNL